MEPRLKMLTTGSTILTQIVQCVISL